MDGGRKSKPFGRSKYYKDELIFLQNRVRDHGRSESEYERLSDMIRLHVINLVNCEFAFYMNLI